LEGLKYNNLPPFQYQKDWKNGLFIFSSPLVLKSLTMNRDEINLALKTQHDLFLGYIMDLSEFEFLTSKDGKWTAGQTLDHILRSVKPLNLAFGLPKFMLKLLFGKPNRISRTYTELVIKYQQKLKEGGIATGQFIPKNMGFSKRSNLNESLSSSIIKLTKLTGRFSEQELDGILLPHPLLGKLTLREMLYFTIYHVQHHHEITKRNLASN
jgi:hypothetical protein